MTGLQIIQIPVLSDNYVYLVHEPKDGLTGVVDPSLAEPVLEALEQQGWRLDYIINTHHHWDHTGGNVVLKAETGAFVVGPLAEAKRIPLIDQAFKEGERFHFGQAAAQIFDIPGHTSGHIAYWFENNGVLFCGDTLFSLGCGRLFEGTPSQMWNSLSKLRGLPDSTRIYCGHEYTEANGRFALTIEPENSDLVSMMARIRETRAQGQPTVPSRLGDEKAANPFLRADKGELQAAIGMAGGDPVAVFAHVRRQKDSFRG
jgi:hydroxyacylglutathione hydrolase